MWRGKIFLENFLCVWKPKSSTISLVQSFGVKQDITTNPRYLLPLRGFIPTEYATEVSYSEQSVRKRLLAGMWSGRQTRKGKKPKAIHGETNWFMINASSRLLLW